MNLPSKFQIGDIVVFGAENAEGSIVSVRFTKSKVFYDILDDYHARVERDVDSIQVGLEPFTPEEIKDFNSLN